MSTFTRSTSYIILGFIGVLIFQSCASTGYSLREPHYYQNSYTQVIKAIEMVLDHENMVITNTEELDENTFKFYFFKRSNRIGEQDFEAGHTAEITVKKIALKRTTVRIEEENNRALVRDEYREHLAKDVFKGLKERLLLEEKNAD